MLTFYKYIFAQGAYTIIFMAAIYYFSKYLTEFFESRPVPTYWTFFIVGLSFYLSVNSFLFIPLLSGVLPVGNYWTLFAIVQPIGALIAAYCMYKIEEGARNV